MRRYILGIDVGGTKIQAGLVDLPDKILKNKQFLLNGQTKKTALDSIMKSAEYFRPHKIKAIGLGITGLVNPKTGMVIQSPNLPASWHKVPLKKIMERKFKVPVTIDNDVHCIALAEALVGLGKNCSVVFCLTLGTGIGAGLVINKKLYHGYQNAIEFGHTIIAEKSPLCSCGRYNHLEALVSGPAMTKLYRNITGQTKDPFQIEKEAKQNKKPAKRMITKMSQSLAVGLINAIHSYNPEIIILGGGLARSELLIQPAIREVKKQLLYPELKKTKIATSRLGYKAGVIGAALITKANK